MLDRLLHPLQILLSLPGILFGLVLHEFMHALAADRMGDPTPRNMGRLTLNPMPHIDPVGLLLIILVGFGWAKPVQINPSNYHSRRKGMLLVPLAGPLTNLALGFLFAFATNAMQYAMALYSININWMNMLYYAAQINFMLFLFNLLPVPPLDGYQILRGVLLDRHASLRPLATLERYGTIILLVVMLTGAIGFVLSLFTNMMFSLSGSLYDWLLALFQ